ncbi:MAG: glycosyltransferase [Pseudobdellovibrio sp.]|nr:glycosyltransferase [Pseudobdellovibrio sp.]
MSKTKILVSTRYFMPGYKAGGPIKSLKNLTLAMASEFQFSVYTSAFDMGESNPYPVKLDSWNHTDQGLDVYYSGKGLKNLFRSISALTKENFDIVYLNSFFDSRYSTLTFLLFQLGIIKARKVLIAPRGEFSPGALKIKSKKKSFFLKVMHSLYRDKRIFWHATAELEATDIKNVFPEAQIQVAENISFLKSERAELGAKNPNSLVFFSRISPKKNLAFALECLKLVKTPLEFHIFGTQEDKAYWQLCEKLISELPKHIKVTFHGELLPHNVVDTLKRYEMFFFPTQGENFGHVIVEALSSGLYTVLSDQTPWTDLAAHGVGCSLSLNNQQAFAEAIENYFSQAPDLRAKTGKKAIDYIQNKLNTEASLNQYRLMFAN